MKNSNYKMTRPTKGYSTEAERDLCSWSGVSDWEVFFKDKKIGIIYKTKTWGGNWGWSLDFMITQEFGYTPTRKEAFESIVYENEQFMEEGE